MNIFGGEGFRGQSGPRGPRGLLGPAGQKGEAGTSGITDLYNWLPRTTLRDFRLDSEDCCFIIWKDVGKETSKDLKIDKDGKIFEWISRSLSPVYGGKRGFHKKAQILEKTEKCSSPQFLEDVGYLTFKKTIYKVSSATLTDTYSCLCATFKVEGKDLDQYIVSNWEKDPEMPHTVRGITASQKEIRIMGCAATVEDDVNKDYVSILCDTTDWTTIFVEWTGASNKYRGSYNINNGQKVGSFTAKEPGFTLSDFAYVGGRADLSHFFNGCISSVEWYSTSDEALEKQLIPDRIKTLMINDQIVEDDAGAPPHSKRMKVEI